MQRTIDRRAYAVGVYFHNGLPRRNTQRVGCEWDCAAVSRGAVWFTYCAVVDRMVHGR